MVMGDHAPSCFFFHYRFQQSVIGMNFSVVSVNLSNILWLSGVAQIIPLCFLGTLERPVEILTQKRDRKSTTFFTDKKESEEGKDEDAPDYSEVCPITILSDSYTQYHSIVVDHFSISCLHCMLFVCVWV